MALERNLDQARRALSDGGPPGLLAYLNAGVRHRFTGVCRFDGPLLRPVLLHDKLGQVSGMQTASSLDCSFCPFRLPECAEDGVGAQLCAIVYHSVPLQAGASRTLWGTLSHFDRLGHGLSQPEFELLQQAGALLPILP